MQIENAKAGTAEWRLSKPGYASGVIEGYSSATSVNRGGQIKLFVSTSDPSYTLEIFRMGYYQGLGGRRMTSAVTLPGIRQAVPPPDPDTGVVECNWRDPYVLNIPVAADPTEWMSGFYYVKLTGSSGTQQYIHFVVRDDSRASDLLLAEAITTAEAYNVWGGKSLYGTVSNRSDLTNAARKVSFDRPFYGDETFGAGNYSDRNDFKAYEWGMVRFLEANGYDVTYATNLDVDRDDDLLMRHRAFLSVGHDEYWSWAMRDHVEAARDRGVSLGFFSANTSYWQVRFEPSTTDAAAARVMVGYKDKCAQDPITPIYLRTCRFRSSPVNRSEDRMLGVMYITQGRMPFVVEDASHWIFTGTGLKDGDTLLNRDGSPFIGYEVDAVGPGSPLNLERAGHSPATPARANFADTTVYRAVSGATVFASGSILWTYDVPQVVQITRNVLARLISNAFADGTPARPPLPAPMQANDIGDVGRAGYVSAATTDAFTLNGAGQDVFAGGDALYYAYRTLDGDGTIVARTTALQGGWDNRAGVMIRESASPTSKYVSLVSRPSESRRKNGSGINEGLELRAKSSAGAAPQTLAMADVPLPNWLKLTRTGNTFQAFSSADGTAWSLLGSATVTMSPQALVGLAVASAQHAVWATASFDHVAFVGDAVSAPAPSPSPAPLPSPPPAPLPSPSASMTLERTYLRFGAVSTGTALTATTAPQTVRLLQTGSGSATWTAVSNRPWLTVSPASGSGSAVLAIGVRFDGTLPLAGDTTGAISLRVSGAGDPVGPIDVTLTTISSSAPRSVPVGSFDTPAGDSSPLAGSIAITGWALDNIGVRRVELWRDPQPGETTPPFVSTPTDPRDGKIFIGNGTFVEGARPDVEALYRSAPLAQRAGWGYLLLTWGLWNRGNGTYTFYAFAFDEEDNVATLGSKRVLIDNNSAARPFGAIDTPPIGGDPGLTPNFGWALTPPVNGAANCRIGPNGVQVSIDSGPLQPVVYGDARSDVAAAFPGFSNSAAAGAHYLFDWSTLAPGTHTIGWLVTDDCNRSDGVGSRFFTVPVRPQ